VIIHQIQQGHIPCTYTNNNHRYLSGVRPVATLSSVDVDNGSDKADK
jgi:hypothetical protein